MTKPFKVGDVVQRHMVVRRRATTLHAVESIEFIPTERLLILSVERRPMGNSLWFSYEMLVIWVSPSYTHPNEYVLNKKLMLAISENETPGDRADAYLLYHAIDSESDSTGLQESAESS